MIVFALDGEHWTIRDYTLRERVEVEKITGHPWAETAPIGTASDLLACLAVWLRRSKPDAEVEAVIDGLSGDRLWDACTWKSPDAPGMPDDDLPTEWAEDGIPLPEGGQTTPGSSGPTAPEAGTPTAPGEPPSGTSTS